MSVEYLLRIIRSTIRPLTIATAKETPYTPVMSAI